MGLKKSKSMKILREKGFYALLPHISKKYVKCQRRINKRFVYPFLTLYPKLVLNKSEYKTFQSVKAYFYDNYRNIITISPLFFAQILKKHIAWIESQEFQKNYGYIFTAHASAKTELSHIDSKALQNTNDNIESKQADSLTWASNAKTGNTKNSIVTPPPPL